jgi:hypothetical protein
MLTSQAEELKSSAGSKIAGGRDWRVWARHRNLFGEPLHGAGEENFGGVGQQGGEIGRKRGVGLGGCAGRVRWQVRSTDDVVAKFGSDFCNVYLCQGIVGHRYMCARYRTGGRRRVSCDLGGLSGLSGCVERPSLAPGDAIGCWPQPLTQQSHRLCATEEPPKRKVERLQKICILSCAFRPSGPASQRYMLRFHHAKSVADCHSSHFLVLEAFGRNRRLLHLPLCAVAVCRGTVLHRSVAATLKSAMTPNVDFGMVRSFVALVRPLQMHAWRCKVAGGTAG